MKIIRMYDREERGGWQFAMVEVETKKRHWFGWRTTAKHYRRVAKEVGHSYFRFVDTGDFTPESTVETMWDDCDKQSKNVEFSTLAQKAYLTA